MNENENRMPIADIFDVEGYSAEDLKSLIWVDKNSEVNRVATVDGVSDLSLALDMSGAGAFTFALDRWRKRQGKKPLFYNEENRDDIDDDAWYEFRLIVHQNGTAELCFWVDQYDQEPEESLVEFDLTQEETDILIGMADEWAKNERNASLEALFQEEKENIERFYKEVSNFPTTKEDEA